MELRHDLNCFLILNFGALGVGSFLMGNGAKSEWYLSLKKAPWTPPGWVFGAVWTTIMICFSIYMTQLYTMDRSWEIILLFFIQMVLNVSWNYLFFNQKKIGAGLGIILLLTLLMTYFLFGFYGKLQLISLLVVPYVLWLIIATSLNAYILSNN